MSNTIEEQLSDLIDQATHERSHNYVKVVAEAAVGEIERLKSGWREAFKIGMDRQTEIERLRRLVDELTGCWTGSDVRDHVGDYPHHNEGELLALIISIRHPSVPVDRNVGDNDDFYTASPEMIAEFRTWQKEKAGG